VTFSGGDRRRIGQIEVGGLFAVLAGAFAQDLFEFGLPQALVLQQGPGEPLEIVAVLGDQVERPLLRRRQKPLHLAIDDVRRLFAELALLVDLFAQKRMFSNGDSIAEWIAMPEIN